MVGVGMQQQQQQQLVRSGPQSKPALTACGGIALLS
jgi:hypothetical protein